MIKQQPDFSNENFEELFGQQMANISGFNNKLVKGKVIKVTKDHVVIDVGLKSEGVIPKAEFINDDCEPEEIKEGDLVEVYIERYENKDGSVVLSKEKAYREENWHKLEGLYREGTLVEGLVIKRVKGGFMVNVKNTIAFLPGSQLDVRPMKNINALLDTKQKLKILTMDRKRYNIVVSRRAAIEEKMKEEGISLANDFVEGQIVEGIVKNITGYGCFVDLGPCDGLLHIIDVSWSRINHPSEVLKVGQTIKVKIIKIHPETERISLGMKQITEDPWGSISEKYAIGSRFTVNITNITDYGYFAELEKGIEGLIHISEISWNKDNNNSYNVGDPVEVSILDIDAKRRRISLSIKQCLPNPWIEYAEKHPVSSVVDCTIKSVDDIGIVVGLNDQIRGFIRHFDISWDDSKGALQQYKDKVGETIQARIIKYDLEREKAYLGIKQLTEDASASKLEGFKKGSAVSGTVKEVTNYNINLDLGDGIVGIIKKAELAVEREDQDTSKFKVGDTVKALVLNQDRYEKVVYLSIKALEHSDNNKFLAEQGSVSITIGDVLDEAMARNKDNFDETK